MLGQWRPSEPPWLLSKGLRQEWRPEYFGKPSTYRFLSLLLEMTPISSSVVHSTLLSLQSKLQRWGEEPRLRLCAGWFYDFTLVTPWRRCECQKVHCCFQQNLYPLAKHFLYLFFSEMSHTLSSVTTSIHRPHLLLDNISRAHFLAPALGSDFSVMFSCMMRSRQSLRTAC